MPHGAEKQVSDTPVQQAHGHATAYRRYLEGRPVYAEGELASGYFSVVRGIVRLVRFTNDGRRCVTDFRYPGERFGLGEGTHRGTFAEAATECIIACHFPDRDCLGRLEKEAAEDCLAATRERLLRVACLSATERVACFLLDLAERHGNGSVLVIGLSRSDIADYLGIRAETLSRALALLRKAGAIDFGPARNELTLSPSVLSAFTERGRRCGRLDVEHDL